VAFWFTALLTTKEAIFCVSVSAKLIKVGLMDLSTIHKPIRVEKIKKAKESSRTYLNGKGPRRDFLVRILGIKNPLLTSYMYACKKKINSKIFQLRSLQHF
jgi:hypothetical protein